MRKWNGDSWLKLAIILFLLNPIVIFSTAYWRTLPKTVYVTEVKKVHLNTEGLEGWVDFNDRDERLQYLCAKFGYTSEIKSVPYRSNNKDYSKEEFFLRDPNGRIVFSHPYDIIRERGRAVQNAIAYIASRELREPNG